MEMTTKLNVHNKFQLFFFFGMGGCYVVFTSNDKLKVSFLIIYQLLCLCIIGILGSFKE